MDFNTVDPTDAANEGAKLELRDATGAALLKPDSSPITITLLGSDSDAYLKTSNALTNRALRNRGKVQLTAESALTDQINLLAKVTQAWDGIGLGEDETAFSEEAAKKLYRIAFVREQVQEFVADRGNFAATSPTS